MFCPACGTENPATSGFCNRCGRPLTTETAASKPAFTGSVPQPPAYTGPKQNSGKAIASVVLGVFALLLNILLLPGILAVVLGHLAHSQIKHSAGSLKGEGMAIAGLVMGYLSFLMIPVFLIIAAIAIPNLLRARIAANEASAVLSIRTIVRAEVTYASTYPAIGYACSLTDLDGEGQSPSEKSAGLIDSGLASGTKTGYRFTLNCDPPATLPPDFFEKQQGEPPGSVTTYQLTAEPMVSGQTGMRTFCSDQTGIIRFSSTGSAEDCLSSGVALQ